MSEQLNTRLSGIYDEIGMSFNDLYAYVEEEQASLTPLIEQFAQIEQTTAKLSQEIRQL